jgi:hypothetical protein
LLASDVLRCDYSTVAFLKHKDASNQVSVLTPADGIDERSDDDALSSLSIPNAGV